MAKYPVVEIFSSINGEGTRQGQLALFVRMRGCNLRCSYCDTGWANEAEAPCVWMETEELLERIGREGIFNITLTGGEPLLQKDIGERLEALAKEEQLRVEIETNGSVPLAPFAHIKNRPSFTMDYKLPGSGMEAHMCPENFEVLTEKDTVKFVAGSRQDLEQSLHIMRRYDLIGRCHVFLSPVFGAIEAAELVEFVKEHKLNDVNIQLQIHKFIWDVNERGV